MHMSFMSDMKCLSNVVLLSSVVVPILCTCNQMTICAHKVDSKVFYSVLILHMLLPASNCPNPRMKRKEKRKQVVTESLAAAREICVDSIFALKEHRTAQKAYVLLLADFAISFVKHCSLLRPCLISVTKTD